MTYIHSCVQSVMNRKLFSIDYSVRYRVRIINVTVLAFVVMYLSLRHRV